MSKDENIDKILQDWPYEIGKVSVRRVQGDDGRDLLHMRLEMGLLQLEVAGRPDGQQPEGCETYYDHLATVLAEQKDPFVLDEGQCMQIDREFVQFYHRRICWLTLRKFRLATQDADHTLKLMDFSTEYAPDEPWALSHEQYRPFVLFHRTQAAALAILEEDGPKKAITEIEAGLKRMHDLFAGHDAEEQYEENELVIRLGELKESLRDHYEIGPTLTEKLSEAIASEEYELAARLRDEIAGRDVPRS